MSLFDIPSLFSLINSACCSFEVQSDISESALRVVCLIDCDSRRRLAVLFLCLGAALWNGARGRGHDYILDFWR